MTLRISEALSQVHVAAVATSVAKASIGITQNLCSLQIQRSKLLIPQGDAIRYLEATAEYLLL
jgi:hypothetical protein